MWKKADVPSKSLPLEKITGAQEISLEAVQYRCCARLRPTYDKTGYLSTSVTVTMLLGVVLG